MYKFNIFFSFICLLSYSQQVKLKSDSPLHCATCQTVINDALVKVFDTEPEVAVSKVAKVVNNICKEEAFRDNEFSHRKMEESCLAFIEKYGKSLIAAMKSDIRENKVSSGRNLVDNFCFRETQYCVGLEEKYLKVDHSDFAAFTLEDFVKEQNISPRVVAPTKEEL